jgi:predicted TPR repeat methyltransferase
MKERILRMVNKRNHIQSHNEYASTYDEKVKEYNSYVHQVLFGMCYEYIKPGNSLLDLGIGTGLSSMLFAKAGMNITGLDESSEMLKECSKKGFAQELEQYNIQDVPWPYGNNTFLFVISCGVFHFFGDLQPIIKDVYRILKPSGIFAFTIALLTEKETKLVEENIPENLKVETSWGIPIFKHSDEYIKRITESCGLTIHKEQKILADSGDKHIGEILYKVMVTQK